MRNGFGPGNGNGEIRAKIARERREFDSRRADVVREVRDGKITLQQAEDKMNGKG